jgi:hypothetical protein
LKILSVVPAVAPDAVVHELGDLVPLIDGWLAGGPPVRAGLREGSTS